MSFEYMRPLIGSFGTSRFSGHYGPEDSTEPGCCRGFFMLYRLAEMFATS